MPTRDLDSGVDAVNADLVVSVTGKQIVTVLRPGQAGAVRLLGVLAGIGVDLQTQLVHHALGLEVPDLDGVSGGSAQPVSVGGEHKRVDDVTSL